MGEDQRDGLRMLVLDEGEEVGRVRALQERERLLVDLPLDDPDDPTGLIRI